MGIKRSECSRTAEKWYIRISEDKHKSFSHFQGTDRLNKEAVPRVRGQQDQSGDKGIHTNNSPLTPPWPPHLQQSPTAPTRPQKAQTTQQPREFSTHLKEEITPGGVHPEGDSAGDRRGGGGGGGEGGGGGRKAPGAAVKTKREACMAAPLHRLGKLAEEMSPKALTLLREEASERQELIWQLNSHWADASVNATEWLVSCVLALMVRFNLICLCRLE